jgi:hypothetical protein
MLRLPDFTQPFIVESDACGVGIGTILIQENRPIAFYGEPSKVHHLLCQHMRKKCWPS